MATIAIDATYSIDPEPTGIAVYSRRLVESLVSLGSDHRLLICYRLSRWKRRSSFLRPRRGVSVRMFQEGLTFWLPWEADLFHSLAQRPPAFRFRKEVVTVFDIFPITGVNYSTLEFRRKFAALIREAVGRASRVITASEYTADQLEKHCGTERSKIRVIPVGVDPPPAPRDPAEALAEREGWVGRGNELVLVVGAVQNRKNTLGAVQAVASLPERYRMVLAGGNGYGSEAVHDYIRRQGLEGRVLTPGYVSPQQLESLYRSASVMLFPSFEEGFGIPVLEAMAHGLPVVAANTSSLPEVGGNAASYADPNSVAQMAELVRRLAEDSAFRKRMIGRGLERVREFTWQRTAEHTAQVYEEVLAL